MGSIVYGCAEQEAIVTMHDPVVRVAVCQTLCIDSDREGNLRRIENALEIASSQGAELACFPETAILGWVNPDAHEMAHSIPGPTSERIGEFARRFRMLIAIGLAEKDGGDLYDAAILVGRGGDVLLKHRKINTLVELLDPPYTRGTIGQIAVADTELGRVGLLICADTFVEDLVHKVAEQSPDLLIVPYGWAAKTDMWPDHGRELARVVAKTAQRAGCAVIGTDLVGMISHGPWRGRTFGGQSVVATRTGNILITLRDRDADVQILEVPVGRADRAAASATAPSR